MKIPRQVFDIPEWKEPRVFSKFEARIDYETNPERSLREFSETWQWSYSSVRRFVQSLAPEQPTKREEAPIDKRKELFYQSLIPFVQGQPTSEEKQYTSDMVRGFFEYWTELNRSKKKMRFELEKTWEAKLRLATWSRNQSRRNGANRSKDDSEERKRYIAEKAQRAIRELD